MSMNTCRQQTSRVCWREAEWPCAACRKPVCRDHRFFSEAGGADHRGGFRIWRHLCATCFALEQHVRKVADEITADERIAFFATPRGKQLTGEWDLSALHEQLQEKPLAIRGA